jgi:hypothetical protein
MGSPCSCAIVLQHDHQAVVCHGNQTDRDHVQVCQGEGIVISPTALPPPPLLSVDHVGDICTLLTLMSCCSEEGLQEFCI